MTPPDKGIDPNDPNPVLFDGSGGGRSAAGWHSFESVLRCPKEYQLAEVRKIKEPTASTPDHFAVGSLFHAGRARWFRLRFASGPDAETSIEDAVREEAALSKLPISAKAVESALEILRQYCEYWNLRPKPDPVAAEYLLGPSPLQDGDDPGMLFRTARLDDASKYPEAGGLLCLGESKTTSTSIADTVNQYTLHGQPMMQLALWKMAPQGEAMHGKVAGIMLDIIKKPYPKDPAKFGRVFVPVTDHAMKWYVDSMRFYLKQAAAIEWDTDVPRNVFMCTRMAGRARVACEFRDLCSHGRSAALKYVMGAGQSLLDHVPSPGREKMPWE